MSIEKLQERYSLPAEKSLVIKSRNVADAAKEVASFLADHRRSNGTVAPSVGVTRPLFLDKIQSIKDALSLGDRLAVEQKDRAGALGKEPRLTASSDSYRQKRWDFVSGEEGFRTRAYDDATGEPRRPGTPKKGFVTVGTGFNMDRPDARKVWEKAGIEADFQRVYNGEQRLNEDQVRRLFEVTINEAEDIVQNKFRGTDLQEHERLALVSLAFNNPALVGPNLTRMIREGDKKGAIEGILYFSNRKKRKGLASRRYREAKMFAGPLNRVSAIPDFKTYMSAFS
jgi:GH24 family phage-related lysozyme (muramidase)